MTIQDQKSYAEDKITQAQERLNLRTSTRANDMLMEDLNIAIESMEDALETLKEVKEKKEDR